jgi:hypothetical protein
MGGAPSSYLKARWNKLVDMLVASHRVFVRCAGTGQHVCHRQNRKTLLSVAPLLVARIGPTTPKRATTSLAASVDPTEARNVD